MICTDAYTLNSRIFVIFRPASKPIKRRSCYLTTGNSYSQLPISCLQIVITTLKITASLKKRITTPYFCTVGYPKIRPFNRKYLCWFWTFRQNTNSKLLRKPNPFTLYLYAERRCPVIITLLRIRRVPCSTLGPETGYPYLGFSWSSSVHPDKCWDSALNYATVASFKLLSNSSFTLSLPHSTLHTLNQLFLTCAPRTLGVPDAH
jgi:hypothetical protein